MIVNLHFEQKATRYIDFMPWSIIYEKGYSGCIVLSFKTHIFPGC